MLAYIEENFRNKYDEQPERTVYHVLHSFKQVHEEKAFTKLEEKRMIKNKTLLDELIEFGEKNA